MHKRTLQVSLMAVTTVFLFVGCTNTKKETEPIPPSSTETASPQTQTPAPQVRTFDITARQFQFEPSTIEVNEGDTVKLTVTSIDVVHGFSIPAFNVNMTLRPNQTSTAEFVANKKGAFTFSCSVVCGADHSTMQGTLIVK